MALTVCPKSVTSVAPPSSSSSANHWLQPVQLYEAVVALAIFALLVACAKRSRPLQLACLGVALGCALRIVIEPWRYAYAGEPVLAQISGLTENALVAGVGLVAAVAMMVLTRRGPRRVGAELDRPALLAADPTRPNSASA